LQRHVFFGLFLLAAGWFYTWTPASFHSPWLESKPDGTYNELSDAFLSGQLSLKRAPDARLVALADPYDPAKNAAFRVNDLSYYHGRYYAYMGPAPAFTLFMPAHLLTGRYLNQRLAASLLNLVGLAASVTLVSRLRRRCLPSTPFIVLVIAAAALAVANGYYVADRNTIAQQVTVANAYAFAMVALWACGNATMSERHSGQWLAAASLSLGIAIASRPNYVFACLALVPPLVYCRREGGANPGEGRKLLAAATLPVAVIVGILVIYNQLRFGTPFDFGQRYILGSWNQYNMPNSGLRFGWENAWHYLVAPAAYSAYFPFVTAPTWLAVSVLRHVPWLWLAPLAAWALFRKGAPGPVRAAGVSALLLAVSNLLTLIFLPSGNPALILTSANARYILDFQPGLTLFVALGVLAACEPLASGRSLGRGLWVPLAACLALASVVIALSLDIGVFPAGSYRPLAYVLDLPAWGLELARGEAYGPLDLGLVFPAGRTGAYEPLVATGTPRESDLLYANYVSPTQIRFGFVSTELKGPVSDPIQVTYGTEHHLRINMGSLYPPSGHPRWPSLSEPQVAFLRRNLRVELDDRLVMDLPVYFHPAAPGEVQVGKNRNLPGYSGESFTGTVVSSRRLPILAPAPSEFKEPSYGAVRMRLLLPVNPDTGAREPLVVTGVPRAGDIVYVEYLGGGSVRLGVDHWGGMGLETGPIPAAPGTEHTVEIAMGSLFPSADGSAAPEHLKLLFDGAVVADADHPSYDSSPYDVTIGVNAIGGSTCGYAFSGRILEARREPLSL
jgi:hypothetical protein